MSTVEVTNDNTGSISPLPDVTEDSCRLQVTDIVPLTTDAVTECHSGNLSFEVKPELLPVVKQEPDDLCGLQFTKIAPLTTDDVCSPTTECESSILCFQVKPEVLEAVKQEPGDLQVCCIIYLNIILCTHSPLEHLTVDVILFVFCLNTLCVEYSVK